MGIMDWLGDIIRNILVIAVLTLFLEILLPAGAAKKYSKFVMGLLILVVMVNPILQVFSQGIPNFTVPTISGEDYKGTDEIVAAGEGLNTKMTAEGDAYYKESLVKQIKSLVALVDGVKDSTVEVYLNDQHNLNNLVIVLNIESQMDSEALTDPNQQNQLIQDIRQKTESVVGEFYDIPPEKIDVSIATMAN